MINRSIILFSATLGLFACSSSSTSTPAPATDGGTGSDGSTSGGNNAKFTGQIVGFASKTGEAGWNVEAGGVKAQTNAKGLYELALPKDTAFNLSVSDSGGHFALWDQETKISGDFDRGKLRFVEKGTGDALIAALKADPTKGVVTVEMVAVEGSACASVVDFPAGAKIKVDQASATLIYQSGELPDASKTEAQKAESPAATVINVTPDAALNVTVEYTKCKQKAFPVTDGAIIYTGGLKPKAPNTISVYRVFFE